MLIERMDLNGYWDWQLPGGAWQRRRVPSSYTCVGRAVYRQEVALNPAAGQRAFLCFDGIAYCGKLWFNDVFVGDLLPYVPYRFDVSRCAHAGPNLIEVEIEDITADYGPTGGWEDYGGITRDVYVEARDRIGIGDVQWRCDFDDTCSVAHCRVNVWLDGDAAGAAPEVTAGLFLNGQPIYLNHTAASAPSEFEFYVTHPLLWSPDSPTLYDLTVSVEAGDIRDVKMLRVGFREFKTSGSRFILNGQDIFLKGVARHEMWGDEQGFTLTDAQIEQDLRLIKAMGGNFVRLVHYPHRRLTIELCDRLGLLATEEPGLWWSDLSNEALTAKALQVMERTILRDRNSPSVIAWLLFNECNFAGMADYLARGRALCDRLDGSRLVAAANCLDPAEAKRIFDQTGMDFYTFHPYGYEPTLMIQGLEALRGKPCVFTEWGGWLIMDNKNLMRWFGQVLAQYAHNRDPLPNLAGLAWWQFQDVFQFSRGLPGCVDGTLTDGLVDKYRNKKPMFAVMADYFAAIDSPTDLPYRLETRGQLVIGEDAAALAMDLSDLQNSAAQRAAWESVLDNLKVYQASNPIPPRRHTGPLIRQPLENLGGLNVRLGGRPLILTSASEQLAIACGFAARKLYFLGQTTFFDGYPLRGLLGEAIARYTICYRDGSNTTIDLRNGYEMAGASLIARTSRIDATAANTRRVAVLHLEEDWEVYQIGCLEVETDPARIIDRIEFASLCDDFRPLLYGVSATLAQASRDE
jgi:beta-glucuronidase